MSNNAQHFSWPMQQLAVCTSLIFGLAQTVPAGAQQTAPITPSVAVTAPPIPATNPATTSSNALRLNVVVTPSSGEPVANLPQSSFTVLDNGQPQTITSFRAVAGTQAATQVILVVDSVNIRYTQLAYARQEIESYLKDNGGHLQLPTSIVIVSDTKTETTGFSTDGNGLSATLEDKVIGLRDLTRSSGFYGAQERLDISLKAFREVLSRAAEAPGHKLVIWISPGWPLLSGPGVELSNRQVEGIFGNVVGFSTAMHQADVTVYSVDPLGSQESVLRTFYYEQFLKGLRKPGDAQLGNLGLQVLAVQSGGLALNSSNDVRHLIEKAIRDTHAEYQITIAPSQTPADGKYGLHNLEVRVPGNGLKARTYEQYYVVPPSATDR